MAHPAGAIDDYDLEALRRELRQVDDGELDDSIPQLTTADRDSLGIAVALPDGRLRATPDADVRFSIQSAVKPFVYALALADCGAEALDAVGTEPTGEAFDAVVLESETGRPPNPMVNAGALLTASLVAGDSPGDRIDRILGGLSGFAGEQLEIDPRVRDEELELGDRNRALGYLMRSAGTLHVSVDDAVEVYATACSVNVSARLLAVMGATLAFGGRNPATGNRVLDRDVVTTVLSVMATCGMYDGSGRWLRRVGLPAKSGVSGGLVAAVPGALGFGVYSPPIDAVGNSVRGVLACERLSDDLGLHMFRV